MDESNTNSDPEQERIFSIVREAMNQMADTLLDSAAARAVEQFTCHQQQQAGNNQWYNQDQLRDAQDLVDDYNQ
ncbi:MAG: Peptidyl-prolyl isomerase cwc27, partial [Watsoniomyces obsoletus]